MAATVSVSCATRFHLGRAYHSTRTACQQSDDCNHECRAREHILPRLEHSSAFRTAGADFFVPPVVTNTAEHSVGALIAQREVASETRRESGQRTRASPQATFELIFIQRPRACSTSSPSSSSPPKASRRSLRVSTTAFKSEKSKSSRGSVRCLLS